MQTTSTLCKERQLCAKNDDNFVQTTTTLYKQRRLCKGQRQLRQKFMYDPMKSPERLSPVCPTAVVSVVAVVAVGAVLSVGLV